jgi:hypothetical protein
MTDEPDYPWRGHRERDTEYYTAIGFLCQQWNIAEIFYTHLASDIMRRPRSEHDLIFRHLGIVAISEFMADYSDRYIRAKRDREQLAYVTKYVNQCRINRNAIVHGWANFHEHPENIEIKTKADQRRSKPSIFQVTLKDIATVCKEIEVAARLCISLQFLFPHQGTTTAKRIMGDAWQAKLFAKPALPKLVSVNPNTPQTQPIRPKSSRPKWRARQPRKKPAGQG